MVAENSATDGETERPAGADTAAQLRRSTVSVVVPTWQRALGLDRCLSAVLAQGLAPDEVIVVGRPEDRNARNVTQRHAATAGLPVRWVDVPRPGYVAPVRRGIAAARHELVAFLDDDTEPEPGWLAALLEPFANDNVACVGGRVVLPGRPPFLRHGLPPDPGCVRWYGKYVGHLGAADTERVVDVYGVMESNWAWRVDVLRCLEFDELFDTADALHYGLDLCLQARSLGYRVVYTPRARAIHYRDPRPDGAMQREERLPRAYVHGRNLTHIWFKRYQGIRRAAFPLWWWLVGEPQSYGLATAAWDLFIFRRGSTWAALRAAMRGRWDGLKLNRGSHHSDSRSGAVRAAGRLRVAAIWSKPAGDLALFRELARSPNLDFGVIFSYQDNVGRGLPGDATFPRVVLNGSVLKRNVQRATALVWNPGLTETIRSWQPDLLLIGGYGHLAGLRSALWARRKRVPWVLVSESWVRGHWLRWQLKRFLLGGLLRSAAGYISLGDRGASYLRGLGVTGPILRIHSNRDLQHLASEVDRIRGRAQVKGVTTFLFVGRLVEAKGFDVLLKAFSRMVRLQPGCRLVVAGDGPLRDSLAEYARRGVPVVSRGAVAFSELPSVLAEADVLVLPSRSEPWGQVVPEAMAAGLPVIASNAVGSVPAFVRPGETGWIVPAGDSVKLTEAMEEATRSPLGDLGVHAREIALRSDVRKVAADIGEFLAGLRGTASENAAGGNAGTQTSRPRA